MYLPSCPSSTHLSIHLLVSSQHSTTDGIFHLLLLGTTAKTTADLGEYYLVRMSWYFASFHYPRLPRRCFLQIIAKTCFAEQALASDVRLIEFGRMQGSEEPSVRLQSHARCDKLSKAALIIISAATLSFPIHERASRSSLQEQCAAGVHTLRAQRPCSISQEVKV